MRRLREVRVIIISMVVVIVVDIVRQNLGLSLESLWVRAIYDLILAAVLGVSWLLAFSIKPRQAALVIIAVFVGFFLGPVVWKNILGIPVPTNETQTWIHSVYATFMIIPVVVVFVIIQNHKEEKA